MTGRSVDENDVHVAAADHKSSADLQCVWAVGTVACHNDKRTGRKRHPTVVTQNNDPHNLPPIFTYQGL
jgi:hypothetical protein